MIVVLAGGVGAARFLRGLVEAVDPEDITAIVNTGDDFVLHGLHISPDLDTVRSTLADDVGELGWGRANETWRAMEALDAMAEVVPKGSRATSWFRLGDRDLAIHLYRTQRLGEGATLSTVTAELSKSSTAGRSIPELPIPGRSIPELLPMSDDRVTTMVTLVDGREVDFQEYFVSLRHNVAVTDIRFAGSSHAKPAPGVLDAIERAERLVIAPSNPMVSIDPILAVPGISEAVSQRRERNIAISPIVAGHALKGPADRMLVELGHESSVAGIARLWAPIAATLVVDFADAKLSAAVEAEGMHCVVTGTVMEKPGAARALADDVMHLALPPLPPM